jgi:hypothetical protein
MSNRPRRGQPPPNYANYSDSEDDFVDQDDIEDGDDVDDDYDDDYVMAGVEEEEAAAAAAVVGRDGEDADDGVVDAAPEPVAATVGKN